MGVPTTTSYHLLILDNEDFVAGNVDTGFIVKHADSLAAPPPPKKARRRRGGGEGEGRQAECVCRDGSWLDAGAAGGGDGGKGGAL